MASNSGKIQLALRNTIDTQAANPPPVLQASIYGLEGPPPVARHLAPPAAKPVPPAPFIVDVISGSKRENKTFPSEKTTGETNGQPEQVH
jgi:hypothetical protein